MAYSAYPTPMRLLHIPSSSSVLGLGGFVLADSIALEGVVIYLARFGTAGGSETLTAKVYRNDDLSAPIASSSAVTLSTLSNMTTNWAGWARFTFSSNTPLVSGERYFLGLTTANYTKNGTTYFLAVQMDEHSPFNQPAWGAQRNIAKFRIEGGRQWPE